MDPAPWRFYLDEDVPASAAQIGRALGLDVVAVTETDRRGWSDESQLRWAAGEGRVLVTYNRNDFLELTRTFFAVGKAHAGVIVAVPVIPREGAAIAHALQRFSGSRPPLQPYELQFLSGWSADD